ncbi:hypothetical protein Pcinc_037570 [Petrolisthes cinctipes]|uniref:Probable tRNA(His) guanylyltransferase n=1 Tax=Petrolisthes cinctipes TaxID=88211 RepID=A0AAE1BS95_PETCI|nr:hypothetical protein Pcinc_037570 [Petrolisthes cinctipes]
MANSRFEYVKSFENPGTLDPRNWIVVTLSCRNVDALTRTHNFEQPNDSRFLRLVQSSGESVMREIKEIVLGYQFAGECSFVFGRNTTLYKRRGPKLLTNICSLMSSCFVYNWTRHFGSVALCRLPVFEGVTYLFPEDQNLRDYLTKRQKECHNQNLYQTCLKGMICKGMSTQDAINSLQGTSEGQQNEILFTQCGINYNNEDAVFKKGTVMVRDKVNVSVITPDGSTANRKQSQIITLQTDLVKDEFWTRQFILDQPTKANANKHSYLRAFEKNAPLLPETWIVVRVDGKGFHKFSERHDFRKPNDKRSLELMNRAAISVMNTHTDIMMAYGQSDEYSFIIRKDSTLLPRKENSTVLPRKENSTVLPRKENSTLLPRKENSTVLPRKENSTVLPRKENSTLLPRKENSTVLPRKENSTLLPRKENSTLLPRKENSTLLPRKENSTLLPRKENSTVLPRKENSTLLPRKENSTLLPRKENSTLLPRKENSTVLPRKENSTVLPRKENSTLLPRKENSTLLPRKENSTVLPRKENTIISRIVSLFSAQYVREWPKVFVDVPMSYPPSFDGRCVLYPNVKCVRDYFNWRQADCHINNLYNTCFWALVENGGCSPRQAEAKLRGTFSDDKRRLLSLGFGRDYDDEEEVYRKGTVMTRKVVKSRGNYDEEKITSRKNYDVEKIKSRENYDEEKITSWKSSDEEKIKSRKNSDEEKIESRKSSDEEKIESWKNSDEEKLEPLKNSDVEKIESRNYFGTEKMCEGDGDDFVEREEIEERRVCEREGRVCEREEKVCERKERVCERQERVCEKQERGCEKQERGCEREEKVCERQERVCEKEEQKERVCEREDRVCEREEKECERQKGECEREESVCERKEKMCERQKRVCEKQKRVCEGECEREEKVCEGECEKEERVCEREEKECERQKRVCEREERVCEGECERQKRVCEGECERDNITVENVDIINDTFWTLRPWLLNYEG